MGSLFKREQNDFGAGSNAHGRTPGSDTVGGVNLKGAKVVQAVGELAEDAVCKPFIRK